MKPIGHTTPHTRVRHLRGERVASLRYLPSGLLLQLEVPWDKNFTAALKSSVQTKKRAWDGNDKCWYVAKDQFDRLCFLLDKYFDDTVLIDFPQREVSSTAWSKLWLLEGAPLEVVRAVYRTLSMLYHPDKGGDMGTMQAINLAYKEILGELTNEKETQT